MQLSRQTVSTYDPLHPEITKANIVSQFAKDEQQLPTLDELRKGVIDDDFEKGGEGSKGGKVIGHTKSGKPLYEQHNEMFSKLKEGVKKYAREKGGFSHIHTDPYDLKMKNNGGSEHGSTHSIYTKGDHEMPEHSDYSFLKEHGFKPSEDTKGYNHTTKSGQHFLNFEHENGKHQLSVTNYPGSKEAGTHGSVDFRLKTKGYNGKHGKTESIKKAEEDDIQKAEFSTKERKKLAKEGEAEKNGSYPIETKTDLHNAVQAYGRSKDKAKTKAWIKKRAKELDCEDCLPDDWHKAEDDMMESVGEGPGIEGAVKKPKKDKVEKAFEDIMDYANDPIEKALNNILEKGGEGSKGGKIIGHTKSGKPIYEHFDHASHNGFSREEHLEAMEKHDAKRNQSKGGKEKRFHGDQARKHFNARFKD